MDSLPPFCSRVTTWPVAVGFMASLIIPSHSANFLEAFKSLHHLGKCWRCWRSGDSRKVSFPSLSSWQWNLTTLRRNYGSLETSTDFGTLSKRQFILLLHGDNGNLCRFELHCSSSSFDEDILPQHRQHPSASPSTVLAAPQWIFGEIQVNEDADFMLEAGDNGDEAGGPAIGPNFAVMTSNKLTVVCHHCRSFGRITIL